MNQRIALAVASVSLACAAILAGLFWRFLPGHEMQGVLMGCSGLGGAGTALLAGLLILRMPDTRRARIALGLGLAILVLVPLLSLICLRRFTYARFGLTIYGLFPVPVLDVTVGVNGGLWFREKNHLLTLAEVQPFLTPGVEVVVIGTGWNEAMKVEEAVRRLPGVDVRVRSTPAALEEFNRLIREGRRVVLLAHSTC